MILVRIELHSAVTHQVTPLGEIRIANDGTGSAVFGNYNVELRDKFNRVFKQKRIEHFPRIAKSVWELMRRALA